jgi:hypothetical protein
VTKTFFMGLVTISLMASCGGKNLLVGSNDGGSSGGSSGSASSDGDGSGNNGAGSSSGNNGSGSSSGNNGSGSSSGNSDAGNSGSSSGSVNCGTVPDCVSGNWGLDGGSLPDGAGIAPTCAGSADSCDCEQAAFGHIYAMDCTGTGNQVTCTCTIDGTPPEPPPSYPQPECESPSSMLNTFSACFSP